jgi:EmrB/QacA subfamily drug resistance transporter
MAGSTTDSALSTRRGQLILLLVCAAAFLDFVDTTIVNVALPSIGAHLHFSEQNLQWTVSGYLLTYGGFLLLGGRAGDLIGRRRLLVAGTTLFGVSSFAAGIATSQGVLIAARLAQGAGAAMMTPAALSTLTTTFRDGRDRIRAIGVWSATIPLASAIGVLAGGLLSEGPGWRWVFFVNLPVCALVIIGALRLLDDDHVHNSDHGFDFAGAVLSTAGMLVLVHALVRAPSAGWTDTYIIIELLIAAALLIAFVLNERRHRSPLVPFEIFRIRGLAAADATQVIAQAGFYSLFFFVTLYMQSVLGFSPVRAGAAYLPVTLAVGASSVVSTKLLPRVGTRPIVVTGSLLGAIGLAWLSRMPVHGTYSANILPGLVTAALGLGAVFVGVQTAANAGVPEDKAGLAAALITTSATVGGALGLAIFSAIATGRTNDLLAAHVAPSHALVGGFHYALVACSAFLIAAAAVAVRATNVTPAPVEPHVITEAARSDADAA